ncbi:MAG TPA: hypothetical protein VFV95_01600 [Vicinamibacterales bacterium]|nr:hypothetical protein [Vicinamibacterales bacterium]
MSITRLAAAAAVAAVTIAGRGALDAQLPLEPKQISGQSVTPAYEGWFRNADGSFSLLVGYYNRNQNQTLDIPIGAKNRIEPGGPDQGQPTHFLTRRQWGVFTLRVPADFGDRKLTWTIEANNQALSVPMGLHRDYEIQPLKDAAEGNTPPVLKLDPKGPSFQGPPIGIAASRTATTATPLTLTLWAIDDGKTDPSHRPTDMPLTVGWSHFRGAGAVTFSNPAPAIDKADGRATTTVTFSAPGDYVLRAQANDVSGDGGNGFQCCWTNALVKVAVKP